MGKIIKKRIEYGGSSNSAENIKYNDTKNVKEAINEVGNLLGNTDISAIGDGTVTGGLNALNSNLELKVDEIFNCNNTSNEINSDGSGIGNKITIPNASKYKAYAIVFYFSGYTGYTQFVIAPNEVNKIQRCSYSAFWPESGITNGQTSIAQLVYDNGNVTLEAVAGARYSYNTYRSYSSCIVRAYGLY